MISKQLLKNALNHIEKHWESLERYCPHDDGTLIGLPYPYLVPSNGSNPNFRFVEMYYWDNYFIIQGLLGTSHQVYAFYMLENLIYLMKRFQIIPNGSRFYLTSRSQPPFLTSIILDIYNHAKKFDGKKPSFEGDINKKWLTTRMDVAKDEYRKVWMSKVHPSWRQVFKGLSRYYQTDVLHSLAEAESGWDMNPRFERKALSHVPIDLNSLLYKYEVDFAQAAQILGEEEERSEWLQRAAKRKATINKYLWNQKEGFYFDYNFETGRQSKVWSLAPYFAMWAGMVSEEKAKKLVNNLDKFEFEGGLVTTLPHKAPWMSTVPMQWAYPNGWAPLHWIVIKGLQRYGYQDLAKRIAHKWINANLIQFQKKGKFLEKYNAVDPDKNPAEGVYPIQTGFAWTNAIFARLVKDFNFLEKEGSFSETLVYPRAGAFLNKD